MVITVIGAGHIGSAIAGELTRRDEIDHVKICDAHTTSLQHLQDSIESDKLRSFQVDARDLGTLSTIMDGSDCVIASANPELNPVMAAKCLEIGSHFCDLGGLPNILEQHVELRAEASKKGLWIVPNCGLDPGLVNILCLSGTNRFDTVDSVRIRVGDVPIDPEPPFHFRLAWSPEKLIDDYTNPVSRVKNGRMTIVEPLSGLEHIDFGEPFGRMESFYIAGSIRPMIDTVDGSLRTFDHKAVRWPGHRDQMQFVLGLGFGEAKNIDVRTHLTYRDVLVRRMKRRLGGEFRDAVLCRIALTGTINGESRTLVYQMIDRYDSDRNLTAMRRCTSIPVASVATMLASGAIVGGGVEPPECILPGEPYIEDLRSRGLDIREFWPAGNYSITQSPESPSDSQ